MYGREELDLNKLVYATDIDTMLVDCEGTEVWPQDSDGCEYYFKSQADKVMDAMEARIKELEEENKHLDDYIDVYQKSEALDIAKMDKKDERIKELESQLPKWLSVKERLPNVGDIVLVCFDDRVKAHYFPIDVVRWDSSYQLQERSVTHWMPLPSAPTTEDSSAIEKEK